MLNLGHAQIFNARSPKAGLKLARQASMTFGTKTLLFSNMTYESSSDLALFTSS